MFKFTICTILLAFVVAMASANDADKAYSRVDYSHTVNDDPWYGAAPYGGGYGGWGGRPYGRGPYGGGAYFY